jgi:hypothetical protein
MSPPSLGGDTDTNGGGEWGNKFRGMAGGWMAVQTPAFGRVAGFGIGGGFGAVKRHWPHMARKMARRIWGENTIVDVTNSGPCRTLAIVDQRQPAVRY